MTQEIQKKYYFIAYASFTKWWFGNSDWVHCSELIEIHPLQWQIEKFQVGRVFSSLQSWQEVSEEEFNQYKAMNYQAFTH